MSARRESLDWTLGTSEAPSQESPGVVSKGLIHAVAERIIASHRMPSWRDSNTPEAALPSLSQVVRIVNCLEEIFFPCFRSLTCSSDMEASSVVHGNLQWLADAMEEQVTRALPFRWLGDYARSRRIEPCPDVKLETAYVVSGFFQTIPRIRQRLMLDVEAAYQGDPAAKSYAEIILSYPGLRAISVHRIAHELYRLDVPLLPRMMSEYVHANTGIDIHPGATIGRSFFIDHGTGVVIGETASIGDRVKLYQGVTLGAKSIPLDENGTSVKGLKRHPTIGNDIVIYAGATVLGGDVVVGDHSIIGGNVWLTESVDPYSFVHQEHHKLVRVSSRYQAFDPVL